MVKRHFAEKLNFYKLFWIFMIGCFLGTMIEMTYGFITNHGLIESRAGLIYGPFNPVYGLGAVIMSLSVRYLSNKRNGSIFLGSMFIGSVFEYLSSLFQQYAVGSVSWDYSYTWLNIGGRTSLIYGIFWGFLGLLWVRDIFPKLSEWIEKVPYRIGTVITWGMVAFMLFNIVISGVAVIRWNERINGQLSKNQLETYLDQTYPDKRMKTIYPNMVFKDKP